MADPSTPEQPDTPVGCPPHTLKMHQRGIYLMHDHAEGGDHDHDDFDGAPNATDHALWVQDNVVLHSVGIDIGSAGTQVVFSKIHLQRVADQLSTRYMVVSREPIYQSPSTLILTGGAAP